MSAIENIEIENNMGREVFHSTLGTIFGAVQGSAPEWISDTDFYRVIGEFDASLNGIEDTYSLGCILDLHERKGVLLKGKFDKQLNESEFFKTKSKKTIRTIKGVLRFCKVTSLTNGATENASNPGRRYYDNKSFDFGKVRID